jgi:excisionase family DNA binding protein
MGSRNEYKSHIFLTEKEAAELLRFSSKHLQRMRAEHRGPPFFKEGRAVRYKRSDIVAWMELRRENGTKS